MEVIPSPTPPLHPSAFSFFIFYFSLSFLAALKKPLAHTTALLSSREKFECTQRMLCTLPVQPPSSQRLASHSPHPHGREVGPLSILPADHTLSYM